MSEQTPSVEIGAAGWVWPARWAEVRSTLDEVAVRMDDHAYSELSSLLDDGPPEGEWDDGDRRDVAAWLIREADQRVHLFPQRRDGIDALVRHLAECVSPPEQGGAA